MKEFSFRKKTALTLTVAAMFGWGVFATANDGDGKNIFEDYDQDGLTNSEEEIYGTDPKNPDTDGDSYSDGVEVETGYNPLKPAPGDKIITEPVVAGVSTSPEDENLTQEITLKLGELVTDAASGGTDDVDTDEVNAYIDNVLSQQMDFSDLPEVSLDEIIVREEDYSGLSEEERKQKQEEDVTQYLTALTYIFVSNSPQDISGAQGLQSFQATVSQEILRLVGTSFADSSYFFTIGEQGEKILEEMLLLEVPPEMVDLHARGIQLGKYGAQFQDEVGLNPQDPASTIVILSKMQGFLSLSSIFVNDIFTRLDNLGIEFDYENALGVSVTTTEPKVTESADTEEESEEDDLEEETNKTNKTDTTDTADTEEETTEE